jgi:quercetin dioxygenase-like cupin family protein
MQNDSYHIHQLLEELEPPDTGKRSIVVIDNEHAKVVLFAFAAGAGLAEHVAPLPAIIQVIRGDAQLKVGDEEIFGRVGTWIQMAPKTSHSIMAKTPLTMLLTLLK